LCILLSAGTSIMSANHRLFSIPGSEAARSRVLGLDNMQAEILVYQLLKWFGKCILSDGFIDYQLFRTLWNGHVGKLKVDSSFAAFKESIPYHLRADYSQVRNLTHQSMKYRIFKL